VFHGAAEDKHKPTTTQTIHALGKHMWPQQFDMKARVVGSMALLLGAKLLNVQVPILFKDAVDTLANSGAIVDGSMHVVVPVTMLLGYGAARSTSALFSELRNAIFGVVAQSGIRSVAADTFRHLHNLDLKFHLNRNTGALARAIDRGSRGIDFALIVWCRIFCDYFQYNWGLCWFYCGSDTMENKV
jgi:ABC-type multidrug transport system fused ATPase/permease subunit